MFKLTLGVSAVDALRSGSLDPADISGRSTNPTSADAPASCSTNCRNHIEMLHNRIKQLEELQGLRPYTIYDTDGKDTGDHLMCLPPPPPVEKDKPEPKLEVVERPIDTAGKPDKKPEHEVVDDKITEPGKPDSGPDSPDTHITEHVGKPKTSTAKSIYRHPKAKTGEPDDNDGYDYLKEAEDWHSLGSCGASAELQSPIDLIRVDLPGHTKGVLWFDYFLDVRVNDQSGLILNNDGHGLEANLKQSEFEFGFVKIVNDEFRATDLVFHSPAEHWIGGARFPLEVQIYHENVDPKDNRMLAVSIIFEEVEDANNLFLQAYVDGLGDKMPVWSLETYAQNANLTGVHRNGFDMEYLLPSLFGKEDDYVHPLAFFNYEGSLTQPPCTTGVDWWVTQIPVQASPKQIEVIRKAIEAGESSKKGNARPIQPRGERSVLTVSSNRKHWTPRTHDPHFEIPPYRSSTVGDGVHFEGQWPIATPKN